MRVTLYRLDGFQHRVTVERADGSSESIELVSKDFLRHDLAHFAVELELGLRSGVWGCVSRGASLDGSGLDGEDMVIAERLAGPMQTLMRTGANRDEVLRVLSRVVPDRASPQLATLLSDRMRASVGHWAATGYRQHMTIEWPDDVD